MYQEDGAKSEQSIFNYCEACRPTPDSLSTSKTLLLKRKLSCLNHCFPDGFDIRSDLIHANHMP
jgi:hypothetical protein